MMASRTTPREIAALRRALTMMLSAGNEGFQLDIALLEAIFDEEFARRRMAETEGADLDRDFRRRLEHIMLVFAEGCRVALRDAGMAALVDALTATPDVYRGFAFEGAAQGLLLLDHRSSSNIRAPGRAMEFLRGPALRYPHVAHMGIGAGPILQRSYDRLMQEMDPSYRWYAVDGYGFREGYVYRARRVLRMEALDHPDERARTSFDRGIARSLWFLYAADADRVIDALSRFPEERRQAMWSGLGFVCVYTGACDADAAQKLTHAAAGHRSALTQGAAFAAQARELCGNNAQSELVCGVLTGRSVADAAQLVAEAAGAPST